MIGIEGNVPPKSQSQLLLKESKSYDLPRSKLATVEWDYSTYPTSMDEALFSQREDIKNQATAIYQNYISKNTWLGVGPGVISFGNLEIAAARDVAQRLFDVIHQAASLAMVKAQ